MSWTWRNLRMLLKTDRPQSTDLTMLLKLSSMITMSAASFATSVPAAARGTRHCHQKPGTCRELPSISSALLEEKTGAGR